MPREAAAPEALELGILGSCHGLAPGLVDRDQPTTIATLARMVLPDAYIDPTGLGNLAAEYDDIGQLVARYDHGYGLLSRSDANGPAFYTFQAIGHTSELTNATGSQINRYSYDPFGVSQVKTELIDNPFEYAGEAGVMDDSNDLVFVRARYSSRTLGRFLSIDPIRLASGDVNLYRLTLNDPIHLVDPSGLECSGASGDPGSGPGWWEAAKNFRQFILEFPHGPSCSTPSRRGSHQSLAKWSDQLQHIHRTPTSAWPDL